MSNAMFRHILNDEEVYEVFVNNKWREVSHYIFRSFTGSRCLNGKVYQGPRYILGTEDLIHKNQVCKDVCLDCGEETITYKFGDKIGQDIICDFCANERLDAEIDSELSDLEFDLEGLW